MAEASEASADGLDSANDVSAGNISGAMSSINAANNEIGEATGNRE